VPSAPEPSGDPDIEAPPEDQPLKEGELEALLGGGPPPSPDEQPGHPPHRPAHERDRKAEAVFSKEETPQSEVYDFEIEPTARDDHRPETEPLPTLSGETPGPPDSLATDDGVSGWGNISLGPDQEPGPGGGEFLLGESTQPPPQPPAQEVSPEAALPSSDLPSEPAHTPGTTARPRIASERKSRKGLIFLLVLVLLGAAGYFSYPWIMKTISGGEKQPEGTLTPEEIQVRSLTRQDGKVVYSVRGLVRNNSGTSVGMIQIEAQFRNNADDVVARGNSFCGNVFEDEQIISGDMVKIRADLQNELGQSLSNSNIQPGQVVPFLVVLENPPAGISKVTVTISGFKETT
jgi:hypothetical protein